MSVIVLVDGGGVSMIVTYLSFFFFHVHRGVVMIG
jgi:hypothetical protein